MKRFSFLRCAASTVAVLLLAAAWGLSSCTPQSPKPAQTFAFKPEPFLDTLQERSFRYFWDETNPANGLTADRAPSKPFCSIAANGFGLTCYLVGVEHGWITREQAAERTLRTLEFFWTAPQSPAKSGVTGYKGFFYHFLDMNTGQRYKEVELSTIDTGLLLAGVLSAQTYFNGASAQEAQIRALADSIYRRADWQWFAPRRAQGRQALSMGWHPEKAVVSGSAGSLPSGSASALDGNATSGFLNAEWIGYNEAMILNVLALGSPTHPLEPSVWAEWTAPYPWGTFYDQAHVNFGPLFGHQYSHVWLDFRGIQDAYMQSKGGLDYFENSRRATLANHAYCVENPLKWRDYSSEIWGLTACDGPKDTSWLENGIPRRFRGYSARGAALGYVVDDGTIAPTAAGGSIPFAPEICVPALKAMRDKYGSRVWGKYGLVDAFNPSFRAGVDRLQRSNEAGWFDDEWLGIDNGPIVLMIENYRNEFVWNLMKKNPYIVAGLKRAGFTGGWLQSKN
jgi:hypothetical protein